MRLLLSLLLVASLLFSCKSESEIEDQINQIPLEVSVIRFDSIFANAGPSDLAVLKEDYAMFFPERFPDSIWTNRMRDTLQIEINEQVTKVFPDFNQQTQELELLFKHLTHYFAEFSAPTVYTATDYVDYRNKVVALPEMLVLSIDTYLGADHYFYQGIPGYVAAQLHPEKIPVDVAMAYAKNYVTPPRQSTLLAHMIYQGKLLYVLDKVLPSHDDHLKIGYTAEQLEWSKENEQYIWRYFIEKEVLFSTNNKLLTQFINPAPFSKFYLEIDNESPGRIGAFIGWNMVRSYMQNNDVPLRLLLQKPAQEIYKNSKYKPAK
ncbi:MAG: gliding motility lipoprotein GldB [Gilvibacter sp.]